jgi:hypothetical protein
MKNSPLIRLPLTVKSTRFHGDTEGLEFFEDAFSLE